MMSTQADDTAQDSDPFRLHYREGNQRAVHSRANERVIRTLKYEWFRRVPLIRGLDHLGILLADFALYHNAWRPHTALRGAVPDLIHAGQQWSPRPKRAKTIPACIERCFLPETRITGFRLAKAA